MLWLRFVNLMRLFIAEKPSLGRAIADVLPKPHRKGDGFIECGNGQVVTVYWSFAGTGAAGCV